MKIKELVQNYNLHNSLLEDIEYDKDNKVVKLTIDFCYWQQNDYTDDMPETGIIVIEFRNNVKFNYNPHQINSDEIVKVRFDEENTFTLTVFNDLSEKYIDITLSADSVNLQILNEN